MTAGDHPGADPEPTRILFVYWGRRGAMSRFTLDLAEAALTDERIEPLVSVSRSNELFSEFQALGPSIVPIRTFSRGLGAVAQLWRIPLIQGAMASLLRRRRVQAVVVLMSHVWSPLVAPAVKLCGVPYVVIVHDARPHVGDRTALAHRWLMQDLKFADRVIALSQSVADQLIADNAVLRDRLRLLFLPVAGKGGNAPPKREGPLRVLFFGRILEYKGLSLFIDALEQLRSRGVAVRASVVGEGSLGPDRERLVSLGVNIQNGWIDERHISGLFERHDVVVLSHTEASQSGVAALAFGHGLPVVATPVGGLKDQVIHGQTGLLSARVDASTLADAMAQVALEEGLWESLVRQVAHVQEKLSMRRFLVELRGILVPRP